MTDDQASLIGRLIADVHLVDVIALVAVVWFVWRKVVVPAWQAARWTVREAEDRAILKEIAAEFRPNGGLSLHEIVTELRTDVEKLTVQIAELVDKDC